MSYFSRLSRVGLAAVPLIHFSPPSKVWCEEQKKYQIFTKAQVAEHTTKEKGIWVTYKDGVYDITDFINSHPGGAEKILLAAGKGIDPFWRIYQQHINRPSATRLLEPMRIGTLDPNDIEPKPCDDDDDPFAMDPDRCPGLIFHNNKPCNAEIPPALIMDSWCTPNDLWFVRHHHPVPHIDGEKFRLLISGDSTASISPISLSLTDLRERFPKGEVTTTIQCGGNRRVGMNTIQETSGIPWGPGAISTAKFSGVKLRDVLMYSGLLTPERAQATGIKHVIFYGADDMQASVPIEKALSAYGDTLIAYEMNDETLPVEHGYPIRMIVPGHVGVRNVKWVQHIKVSKEEAEGQWQRGTAYKGFNSSVRSFSQYKPEQVEKIASIQEQPVNSVIMRPVKDQQIELDSVLVSGYAYSGGGRGIVRVDVSIDDGKTWHVAELKEGSEQPLSQAWAWTFWEIDLDIPEELVGKDFTVVCKATDSAYNVQPESPESIWNVRGLNNTSWDRVKVKHVDD